VPGLSTPELAEENIMSLALAWSPTGSIASSYSSGDLRVFEADGATFTTKWHKERAHNNEAWYVKRRGRAVRPSWRMSRMLRTNERRAEDGEDQGENSISTKEGEGGSRGPRCDLPSGRLVSIQPTLVSCTRVRMIASSSLGTSEGSRLIRSG
jgi:hypothetical protein